MYGTVARFRLKPGMEERFEQLGAEFQAMVTPGLVSEHVYRLDAGGNEYLMAVVFESKEAYRANADSPEQHAQYLRFRELLEEDPQWMDGEIVVANVPGR